MYVRLELWKGRSRWGAWSSKQHSAYLEQIAPAIGELLLTGVELVGVGTTEPGVADDAEYDFWLIWRFPDQERLVLFTKRIEELGWHDHFVQINAGIEGRDLDELLAQADSIDIRTKDASEPVRPQFPAQLAEHSGEAPRVD